MRLLGFKSFVDPVELKILPGLTGIVGPNGCGKSNLLEALRWIMGENRPTSIRGAGMEDVIFAGAGSRPAKNFAEVSITLKDLDQNFFKNFNNLKDIEIIRRVTRDIGSAFKVNGKDVRSKDIQMLFADASTGYHSPSLVRQGQISELINANPKSRRKLLEEAAGISGLYQRRHEAELKLKSTETNLESVESVLEQLQNQLKTLEKQAKQANKYREVSSSLRDFEALLSYRKWLEADTKQKKSSLSKAELSKKLGVALISLNQSIAFREDIESKIPILREQEAIDSSGLQRIIIERDSIEDKQTNAEDKIVELKKGISQLSKDQEREISLVNDANRMIDQIHWEEKQLKSLSIGHESELKDAQDIACKAAQILNDSEEKLDSLSIEVAKLTAKHQNNELELNQADENIKKIEADIETIRGSVDELKFDEKAKKKKLSIGIKENELSKMEGIEAEKNLLLAETALSDMLSQESKAKINLASIDGALAALHSEQSALLKIVRNGNPDDDQIVNHVKVEKGLELALGAAIGDDLRVPIKTNNASSGWVELPTSHTVEDLPIGCENMRARVSCPSVLSRRIASIGLVEPSDGPRLQSLLKPGQKLVSIDGDVWRWDGFCLVGSEAPSEATLRLQQDNRLAELSEEIEKIERSSIRSTQEYELKIKELAEAQELESLSRKKRKQSDEKLSENERTLSRTESELEIIQAKLENLSEFLFLREDEKKELENNICQSQKILSELPNVEDEKKHLEDQKTEVETLRREMLDKTSFFESLRKDGESRNKRLKELALELTNWQNRLDLAKGRIQEIQERSEQSIVELKEAENIPQNLSKEKEKLIEAVTMLELKKVSSSEELSLKERDLRKAKEVEKNTEKLVGEIKEEGARIDAFLEAAQLEVQNAKKLINDSFGEEPNDLIIKLAIEDKKTLSVPEIEDNILRYRSQRESLGAVNLRAEEDTREISEEYKNLFCEKEDLNEAIKKLRSGIIKLNNEGRTRLLEAYEEVNRNFKYLFTNLFGGGMAKLSLIESEDPLDAGLEIMCQPPGKKLSVLSLLSGGEQTLTALSLIFAVFLVKPSPICVLDEVDAPLDDANVERFCGLLDEMSQKTMTRFMIITHHALTMSRMDRLYGVTMVERGVSQLVSVDLKKAEELIEA